MQKNIHIDAYSRPNIALKCILGSHGEFFPEFGGLKNVFCRGIFFSYYQNHKEIKADTIQKYINGTSPFPAKLKMYYATADGAEYICQDVQRLVDACMCTQRLRIIQANLHQYITHCNTLDDSLIREMNKSYVDDNASRVQIATYLSCVLISILPLI